MIVKINHRDYREQYTQALKDGHNPSSNYPGNINVKDFIQFMLTPWLVYDVYPRR